MGGGEGRIIVRGSAGFSDERGGISRVMAMR